jgi:hypothetical protein
MKPFAQMLEEARTPVLFWHEEDGGPPTVAIVDVDWLDRIWIAAVNEGGYEDPDWTDAGREAQFMPHEHSELEDRKGDDGLTFAEFQGQALPQITVDNDSPSFWGNGLGGEGGETAEALMNALGLMLAIGRLQNIAKKIERDGGNGKESWTSLQDALKKEGGDVLFYLRQVLHVEGLTLEQAARTCLEKLEAMKATR